MLERKKWSELSPAWRVVVAIAAVVQYALLGAALLDLRRRSADEVRGPKTLWKFVVFVNFFGPLSYFKWGRA